MKQQNDNKPSGTLNGIIGDDSNLRQLSNLRKALIDKFVLNTHSSPTKPEANHPAETRPKKR